MDNYIERPRCGGIHVKRQAIFLHHVGTFQYGRDHARIVLLRRRYYNYHNTILSCWMWTPTIAGCGHKYNAWTATVYSIQELSRIENSIYVLRGTPPAKKSKPACWLPVAFGFSRETTREQPMSEHSHIVSCGGSGAW